MADEFEVSSTDIDNYINSSNTLLQITKFLKVKRLIGDCIKENGKKYFKIQWQDSWVESDEVQKFFPKELERFIQQGKPQNKGLLETESGHVVVKMEEFHPHLRESIDFQTNSKYMAYSQLQKMGFLVGNDQRTEESVQGNTQEGNNCSPDIANVRNQLYWQGGVFDSKQLSHYNNEDTDSSKRQQRRRQPLQLYKCEACGSEFVHRTHLKIHQRTHTGEKPYKCEFCGKGFAQKGNLHVHLKTHTGVKEFVCEFCHRAFVTNAQLVVHVRTHINPNRKKSTSSSFNNKSPSEPIIGNCSLVMTQYVNSHNSKYIPSKSTSMQPHSTGKLKSQISEMRNIDASIVINPELQQHRGVKVSSVVATLPNFQQQQQPVVKSQLGISDNIQPNNNLVLTQDNNIYDLQPGVSPLVSDTSTGRHG